MNKVQFPTRVATLHDIPSLETLINRAYIVEATFVRGLRTDRLNLHERIETPNMWFLVIDAASVPAVNGQRTGNSLMSELAGCVCLDCDGQRGHIALLSVDPDRQGHGLGAQLLQAAERFCRERMCCPVMELEVVNVRTELFPFYTHMGYVPTGTGPFPDKEKLKHPAHLIVMQKQRADVRSECGV